MRSRCWRFRSRFWSHRLPSTSDCSSPVAGRQPMRPERADPARGYCKKPPTETSPQDQAHERPRRNHPRGRAVRQVSSTAGDVHRNFHAEPDVNRAGGLPSHRHLLGFSHCPDCRLTDALASHQDRGVRQVRLSAGRSVVTTRSPMTHGQCFRLASCRGELFRLDGAGQSPYPCTSGEDGAFTTARTRTPLSPAQSVSEPLTLQRSIHRDRSIPTECAVCGDARARCDGLSCGAG
jgi:hypothetical protein